MESIASIISFVTKLKNEFFAVNETMNPMNCWDGGWGEGLVRACTASTCPDSRPDILTREAFARLVTKHSLLDHHPECTE